MLSNTRRIIINNIAVIFETGPVFGFNIFDRFVFEIKK